MWYVLLLFVTALNIEESSCRIFGGIIANISDHPWQVALVGKWEVTNQTEIKARFVGGAFIISKYWAMTAAHVISEASEYKFYPVNESFLVGNCSFYRSDPACMRHKVIKNITHNWYNKETSPKAYDIGLLKVEEEFNGLYEKPLKIPGANYRIHDKSYGNVTGWGGTSQVQADIYQLRSAELVIWPFSECYKTYLTLGVFLGKSLLCAGGTIYERKDTCGGDSGGPLVQNAVAIGITIFGQLSCGQYNFPAVFNSVPDYERWIVGKNKAENMSVEFVTGTLREIHEIVAK